MDVSYGCIGYTGCIGIGTGIGLMKLSAAALAPKLLIALNQFIQMCRFVCAPLGYLARRPPLPMGLPYQTRGDRIVSCVTVLQSDLNLKMFQP